MCAHALLGCALYTKSPGHSAHSGNIQQSVRVRRRRSRLFCVCPATWPPCSTYLSGLPTQIGGAAIRSVTPQSLGLLMRYYWLASSMMSPWGASALTLCTPQQVQVPAAATQTASACTTRTVDLTAVAAIAGAAS